MSKKIGVELREVQQLIKQRMEIERANDSSNLTHVQIRLLVFLYKSEKPIYQKDIEQYLRIRRSSATQMLNVLERNGYIVRVIAKHDARLKEIQITDSTLLLIDVLEAHMNKTECMLRKNIDESDLSVFFKVLDQLKENIKRG
ncbi:MAG: MarR family transcriptional regulator [Clostridiales bacterium]|nr:MarR family transcriptional regulator [Clostridiales bacterium]